tara:strand:+ start:1087 stop:1494 length:408 start_codon:yes stop_codon:yes gene_type:complete
VALAGAAIAARWYNIGAEIGADALSAPEALTLAQAGKITLIDIRRPDEWDRTGVPQTGVPLDLRRPDFVAALRVQVNGDQDRPIALICARGVRSARLAAVLTDAGFTRILDVPEGMMGSGAGAGWLARGLPVMRH